MDPSDQNIGNIAEGDEQDRLIARAAGTINAVIRQEVDGLAATILNSSATRKGMPAPIGVEPPAGKLRVELELTKLRIRHFARVDVGPAVIASRQQGATWAEIGSACGITRQAAHDRWGKLMKHIADAEPEPFIDAVDAFLPDASQAVPESPGR